MYILLLLLIFLLRNICCKDNPFDLNLEPPEIETKESPTDLSVWSENRRGHLKTVSSEETFADSAASVINQHFPIFGPEIANTFVNVIGKAAEKLLENSETSDYITPIGLPCNPNEFRLCFRKTTSTTTVKPSTPVQYRRDRHNKERQNKIHSIEHVVKDDYSLPPLLNGLEHSRSVIQGEAAMNRSIEAMTLLEKEHEKRSFMQQFSETFLPHLSIASSNSNKRFDGNETDLLLTDRLSNNNANVFSHVNDKHSIPKNIILPTEISNAGLIEEFISTLSDRPNGFLRSTQIKDLLTPWKGWDISTIKPSPPPNFLLTEVDSNMLTNSNQHKDINLSHLKESSEFNLDSVLNQGIHLLNPFTFLEKMFSSSSKSYPLGYNKNDNDIQRFVSLLSRKLRSGLRINYPVLVKENIHDRMESTIEDNTNEFSTSEILGEAVLSVPFSNNNINKNPLPLTYTNIPISLKNKSQSFKRHSQLQSHDPRSTISWFPSWSKW